MVLGVGHVGEGEAGGIAPLGGYDEGAVVQGDAISGSGSEEVPGGIFEFGGPVFGGRPGGAMVG